MVWNLNSVTLICILMLISLKSIYSFKARSPNWSLPFRFLIRNFACLSHPHHASWGWDLITTTFRGRLQLWCCVFCDFFSLPLKHTPLHLASNIVLSTLVSNIHNPFSSLTLINLFSHSKHILIRTFLDNRRSTFVLEGQSLLGYVGLSIGEQLPTFRRCLLHQSSSQLKNVLGFD